MDASKSPPTAAEWEELQRDCHPFPAYVDYIYGKDYKPANSEPPEPSLVGNSQPGQQPGVGHAVLSQGHPYVTNPVSSSSASSSAAATGTQLQHTNRMNSANQLLGDFQALNYASGVQPNDQQLQNAAQIPSHLFTQAPTAIHLLGRDELLRPEYSWMRQDYRDTINSKVNRIWTVLEDPHWPADEMRKSRDVLIEVSNKISVKHAQEMKVEATKLNFHKELPNLWNALKTRASLPTDHDGHKAAGNYMISIMATLDEPMRKYAGELVEKMVEAEAQGRNALEMIPGYVAPKTRTL